MAATKQVPSLIPEIEEENAFDEGLENIVTELDELTTAVEQKRVKGDGPRVSIFLPALEGDDSSGVVVDQYEHVTIANETGEQIVYVKRGEHVDVTVPVFMALKQKYPNL